MEEEGVLLSRPVIRYSVLRTLKADESLRIPARELDPKRLVNGKVKLYAKRSWVGPKLYLSVIDDRKLVCKPHISVDIC
jgi:hypothetical protein